MALHVLANQHDAKLLREALLSVIALFVNQPNALFFYKYQIHVLEASVAVSFNRQTITEGSVVHCSSVYVCDCCEIALVLLLVFSGPSCLQRKVTVVAIYG